MPRHAWILNLQIPDPRPQGTLCRYRRGWFDEMARSMKYSMVLTGQDKMSNTKNENRFEHC